MDDGPYSILRRAHDTLDYDEGNGRRIAFDSPTTVEPLQVSVPTARDWSRRVPGWAEGRRDLIIDRLRRSGAIVAEVDDEATRIVSPDGTFAVSWIFEVHNRGWRETRISTPPDLGALVVLPYVLPSGTVRFPRPGVVVLPLVVPSGARFEVIVDVAARAFSFDADARPMPLAELPGRLGVEMPVLQKPAFTSVWRRSPARDIGLMFVCLVFVVGGVWMVFTAATAEDRLAGGAGAVLFAVAAMVHVRRRPPSPQAKAGGRRGPRCGAYLPLMAAVAEVPWVMLMVVGLLFAVGDTRFESTEHKRNLWRAIAAIPPFVGLAAGLAGLRGGWVRGPVQWLFFVLGVVACGGILFTLRGGLLD